MANTVAAVFQCVPMKFNELLSLNARIWIQLHRSTCYTILHAILHRVETSVIFRESRWASTIISPNPWLFCHMNNSDYSLEKYIGWDKTSAGDQINITALTSVAWPRGLGIKPSSRNEPRSGNKLNFSWISRHRSRFLPNILIVCNSFSYFSIHIGNDIAICNTSRNPFPAHNNLNYWETRIFHSLEHFLIFLVRIWSEPIYFILLVPDV